MLVRPSTHAHHHLVNGYPTAAVSANNINNSSAGAAATISVAMNRRDAEALVRAWFSAKAQALGPAYQTSALPLVLGGAQLERWGEVVKQLKHENL